MPGQRQMPGQQLPGPDARVGVRSRLGMLAGSRDSLGNRRRPDAVSAGGGAVMGRQTSPQRREPGLRTVLGAAAALLAATACFVGCATEVSALGSGRSTPAAVLIGAAAAFAVGAVVLVRVAIRLEHRFRSDGPAAREAGSGSRADGSGARAAGSGGRAAPSAVRRASARHPRNSPVTRIAGIVIIIGAGVTLTTIAVQLHSRAALSSYTQQQGRARDATVEAVHPVSHDTSHDSWTTYDYDVALAVPAGPATRTIAYDPTRDFQQFSQGDKISVLVDPRQPGYAELPGVPVESSWWFTVPLTLAVIFLAPAVLIPVEEIRHRRRRSAGTLPASG